jgi:hypothetical protein
MFSPIPPRSAAVDIRPRQRERVRKVTDGIGLHRNCARSKRRGHCLVLCCSARARQIVEGARLFCVWLASCAHQAMGDTTFLSKNTFLKSSCLWLASLIASYWHEHGRDALSQVRGRLATCSRRAFTRSRCSDIPRLCAPTTRQPQPRTAAHRGESRGRSKRRDDDHPTNFRRSRLAKRRRARNEPP